MFTVYWGFVESYYINVDIKFHCDLHVHLTVSWVAMELLQMFQLTVHFNYILNTHTCGNSVKTAVFISENLLLVYGERRISFLEGGRGGYLKTCLVILIDYQMNDYWAHKQLGHMYVDIGEKGF